ncbi:MAG: aldehyde ferredoxin oxidoreductase family protein [Desulfobacterales bacterium]|nr:MAG: aldehyde ferredoxin oxidoreductase family protein [Desulfobacterales bacterium]
MSTEDILYGYNGKILHINLSNKQISIENPPSSYYRRYIGGCGFLAQMLLTQLEKGVDPLGPENKLIFALGPFTGHPIIGSGRNSVGAKSPLTGGFGESDVGGFWGARLRQAGYDAIIVEAISAKPVYIFIDNEEVRIRDASAIWGLEVAETVKAIHAELGGNKISTAVIGPGGERLIRYACIINDSLHAAGRTGMGAVMGSKKLKAIAIRGNQRPQVADKEKISELSRWMSRNFKEISHVCDYGTGASIENYERTGNLPIRNFQGGDFPGVKNITPQKMFEKAYVAKMDGCFGCPLRCKRRVKLVTPWKVEPVYGGPEYETLAAVGPNCGIDHLEALIKASDMCNRHGIDTMSTGVAISFAMECFEDGIIGLRETEGIQLNFGNAEAMLKMIEKIALRKGLGDILAEGTKRAAEIIGKGAQKYAMHVKGLELPMHEPRLKKGMGLHYSVHSAGADHCTGIHDNVINSNLAKWEGIDFAEPVPGSELSPRKARMLYQVGIWRHIVNYLGLCLFVPWSYGQIQ